MLRRFAPSALVAAGVALGAGAELASYLPDHTALAAGDFVTGIAFVLGGAVALRRSTRIGTLLAATGCAWFLGGFVPGLVFLHRGPLVHLLLSYPRGRLETRPERVLVAVAYADGVIYALGHSGGATAGLMAAVLAAAALRRARAGGAERRARSVALVATAAPAAVLAAAELSRLPDGALLWAYEVALVLVASALTADQVRCQWTRNAVSGVVVDLGDIEREATLRARLARSVGDPSLDLGYWDPAAGRYFDEDGRAVEPAGRAALHVHAEAGEPVALIVHDPAVLGDPALAEGVTAAVRIAVANLRLQAEVHAKVEQVRASRRRLVEAADAERRRLEEDLRHATESRLCTLATLLGEAGPPLADQRRELDAVREELHELARGIHPRVLTEDGLAAGLRDLARSSQFPVEIDCSEASLPEAVAAAAYFVVSEALANVAKHASAGRGRIVARQTDDCLMVEVADDGAGGADPARGSGLRGLADRVEAVGGELRVESSPGHGTRLRASIPLTPAPVIVPVEVGVAG